MADFRKRLPLPDLTDEEEAEIQAGIAQDPDNPELTEEQLANLRPASEVLPKALFAALVNRAGSHPVRPSIEPTVKLTLDLDAGTLEAWRASGPDWQGRINTLLAREAPRPKRRAR